MTILISIPTMHSGGAERVTSILCNGLVAKGHHVILVTDVCNHSIFYELSDQVKIVSLEFDSNGRYFTRKIHALKYIFKLRKILKTFEPDYFISVLYVTFIRSVIAKLGLSLKYIVSDHTSFDRYTSFYSKFIRFRLYSFADKVTILSCKDLNIISRRLKNVKVIYNPSSFHALSQYPAKRHTILCAGRLDVWDVKGFDIILKIWADLCGKYPDWLLQIAGTGSESSIRFLHEQVRLLHIEDRVCFLGQVNDMELLLKNTSVFALPSRTEGFPMVLLEAMSQGCACISFSLKAVVDEIFLNPDSGISVADGNVDEFKDKLSFLIENENYREMLGINALGVSKQFSVERFISDWNNLFKM